MRDATGKRAKMWGSSIVGYDRYDYKYESGREGGFMITGFSPRAKNISIYIMPVSEIRCVDAESRQTQDR